MALVLYPGTKHDETIDVCVAIDTADPLGTNRLKFS